MIGKASYRSGQGGQVAGPAEKHLLVLRFLTL
jgi:hypothetical protein